MGKLLLIEDRLDYQKLFSLNISLYLGQKPLIVTKKSDALKMILSKENDFDLIFSKSGDDVMAKTLREYFERENISLPILAISEKKLIVEELNNDSVTVRMNQVKNVLQAAAILLDINAEDMANKKIDDYFSFNINEVPQNFQTTVDLYTEKKSQLVRAYKKNENVDLKKFIENNKKYIYVKSFDRLNFGRCISEAIITQINLSEQKVSTKISTFDNAQSFVHNHGRNLGLNEKIFEVADHCIVAMKNEIQNIQKLSSFLDKILSRPVSFRFRLTLLSSYIATYLMEKEFEKKQSKINSSLKDIITAIYFCDISLIADEMIKITSDDELTASSFSMDKKKLINQHARVAAEYLSKTEINKNVIDIVRHHHGSLNGTGFFYDTNFKSDESIICFLSIEWATMSLKYANRPIKINKNKFIAIFLKKFSGEKCLKYINMLKQLNV